MERSQNYRIVTLETETTFEPARFLEEDLTTLHQYDIEEENCHAMENDPEHGAVFMQFASIQDDEGVLEFARRFGLLVPMRRIPSIWERYAAANPDGPPLMLPDRDLPGENDPRFPDWEEPRPHKSGDLRTRAGVNDTRVAEPLRLWYERIAVMQSIVYAQTDEVRAFLLGRQSAQIVAPRMVFLKEGHIAWRWHYLTLWDAMISQMIDILSDYKLLRCANERCPRVFMTAHSQQEYCSPECQVAQKSRRYRNKQKVKREQRRIEHTQNADKEES